MDKKVAICFFGQPRLYKKILNQWEYLIKELNADVFIHTWYGEDRGKDKIDINDVITDFKPKEIRVSNPHKFIDIIPTNCSYENKGYHVMQKTYSETNCSLALSEYATLTGTKYDICIKVRMDLELHDKDSFISFIKNIDTNDNFLYVAANHWQGNPTFDDNIMVGNCQVLTDITIQYFSFTMDYIYDTKIIPGGEYNLHRFFNHLGIYNIVKRINNLNFDLVRYEEGHAFIMNQNE